MTPSLIQLVCINTTSTQRREEIDAKCGTIDTSSSDVSPLRRNVALSLHALVVRSFFKFVLVEKIV